MPMATTVQGSVRWVASDLDGLPMKRKQVAQACEKCRKRKKRCIHTEPPFAGKHSIAPAGDGLNRPEKPRKAGPQSETAAVRSGSTLHEDEQDQDQDQVRDQDQDQGQDEDATQVAANHLVELSSSRFMGDLNPESIFIQATTRELPTLPQPQTYRDKNDLGLWFPPYAPARDGPRPDTSSNNGDGSSGDNGGDVDGLRHRGSGGIQAKQPGNGTAKKSKSSNRDGSTQTRHGGPKTALSEATLMYEHAKKLYIEECLKLVPSDKDYEALRKIYCEKIHPLFPVLNDDEVGIVAAKKDGGGGLQAAKTASTSTSKSSSSSTAAPSFKSTKLSKTTSSKTPPYKSVFPAVVKQLVSLAVATCDAENAAPYLRLDDGPHSPLLTPREFHRRLAEAILAVIDANVILPLMDHIRATILIAFFFQPSVDSDRNKAALLCNQAMHHFHTLGAHLLGFRPQRPQDNVERIFCALFALDRFCAIMYARPCLMHTRDNGKNVEECIAKQPPCFRLLMTVMEWTDRVIHLYRPRQSFVLIDIPVFESLILDCEAEKLPALLLATVEVLYHTVSVLSCRQPVSSFSDCPSAQDRTHLPLSIINPRRSHSTDRIVWVVRTQPICSLPFVPYAVSLALSVQYKKMRYSRTAMFRTRSRAEFKEIVALLKSMGDVFVSVRVNTLLGESIWSQMEKTANSLAREELENGRAGGGTLGTTGTVSGSVSGSGSGSGLGPLPVPGPGPGQGPGGPNGPGSGPAPGLGPGSGHGTDAHGDFVPAAAGPASTLSMASSVPPAMSTAPAPLMEPMPLTQTVGHGYASFPLGGGTTLTSQPEYSDYRSTSAVSQPLVDLSVLDNLDTDIDLFGNFDPSFDLGAVDTALEANLDMGFPQNWNPWNHVV